MAVERKKAHFDGSFKRRMAAAVFVAVAAVGVGVYGTHFEAWQSGDDLALRAEFERRVQAVADSQPEYSSALDDRSAALDRLQRSSEGGSKHHLRTVAYESVDSSLSVQHSVASHPPCGWVERPRYPDGDPIEHFEGCNDSLRHDGFR